MAFSSLGMWGGLKRLARGPDYPPVTVRLPWRRIDVLAPGIAGLALIGVTVATAQYLIDSRGLPALTAVLIAILSVLPVLFLLRRPLWAWRFMFLGQLFGTFNNRDDEVWPWSPVQVVVILLVLLVVGARVDRPVLAWMSVLTLIPVWIFVNPNNVGGITVLFVVVAVVAEVIGRIARSRSSLSEQLAEQSEVSELEKARRTVLEERTRIAREMHDVVAHHMSMIAVQAETAPYRLPDLPESARAEFTSMAMAARQALTDMRRLLGVLRSEDSERLIAPQPGIGDVPELVAAAQRAGVRADLDVADGELPPEPVGLAAYRIVQEALANASRHAPGAAVRVEIRPWTTDLSVRVHNGPPTTSPADSPGEGHGIAGMRERVTLLGGELVTGPTADGGFAVAARLPYAPPPEPDADGSGE
ncbi:sensor histidine kinase [Phytohabitans houttuyneae]|uniref:histidine kinase n=1 Tax=Phytohabitans houttuyneae TaxID=1076126 RepID=A0A6V8KWF3_9ACTN|nr:histidine kinase [Phytohabitans houttuyneae]GFJ86176.1 two-component sensor histidine kinase [Phytohabitans houttuyneae]